MNNIKLTPVAYLVDDSVILETSNNLNLLARL